jgi:hypothetical protein
MEGRLPAEQGDTTPNSGTHRKESSKENPTRCQRNVNDTATNGRPLGSTGALIEVMERGCEQAQHPVAVYRSLR